MGIRSYFNAGLKAIKSFSELRQDRKDFIEKTVFSGRFDLSLDTSVLLSNINQLMETFDNQKNSSGYTVAERKYMQRRLNEKVGLIRGAYRKEIASISDLNVLGRVSENKLSEYLEIRDTANMMTALAHKVYRGREESFGALVRNVYTNGRESLVALTQKANPIRGLRWAA